VDSYHGRCGWVLAILAYMQFLSVRVAVLIFLLFASCLFFWSSIWPNLRPKKELLRLESLNGVLPDSRSATLGVCRRVSVSPLENKA
jgi:hypothetical protein